MRGSSRHSPLPQEVRGIKAVQFKMVEWLLVGVVAGVSSLSECDCSTSSRHSHTSDIEQRHRQLAFFACLGLAPHQTWPGTRLLFHWFDLLCTCCRSTTCCTTNPQQIEPVEFEPKSALRETRYTYNVIQAVVTRAILSHDLRSCTLRLNCHINKPITHGL